MAKLKRLPFPFNNKICACAFDLVHMDVWGPYSIPTLDGYKYFLTIMDDATLATWLFLMKSKFDVRPLLLNLNFTIKLCLIPNGKLPWLLK